MAKKSWRVWFNNTLPSRLHDKIEPEEIGNVGPSAGEKIVPRVFKPDDEQFIDNPYLVFDYLREFEPLHRADTGAWVLTRYNDVVNALLDPRFGNAPSEHAAVNARNRDKYVCADVVSHILPFLDEPGHAKPRAIIMRRFRRYLRQHPVSYSRMARDQFEKLSSPDQFDWLKDFATPLTCTVFSRILDLPSGDGQQLLRWAEDLLYLFTALPSEEKRVVIDRSLTDFRSYLGEHSDQDKVSLFSRLLEPDDSGDSLSREQVIDNLMLIFADGIGNTDKAMAGAITTLKRHPEQFQLLMDNQNLMQQAVDECLRFESPAQYIGRIAREDVVLYGQTIKKNDTLLLALSAANRDPAVFERPEEFDITRYPNPHISFGKSRHSCIGAPLVRQEMAGVLSELMPVLAETEILFDQQQWDYRPGHRWLKNCPARRVN